MKPTNPLSDDVLGRRGRRPEPKAVWAKTWLSRVGSISLILGAASVINGSARGLWNKEDIRQGLVPRRFENPSRLERRVKALGTSALLARQSNYRMPGENQANSASSLLAGADNCPGTPIPPGNYTAAAAPYTDSGDTTGANNTVANYSGTYYYTFNNGPDHVYSFTLTGFGPNPRIEVSTTNSTFNTLVYVLNGMASRRCPAGGGNGVYASLVSDQVGGGGTEYFEGDNVR